MNNFFQDLQDVVDYLDQWIFDLQYVLLNSSTRFRYVLFISFTLFILPFVTDLVFSLLLSFNQKKPVIFNIFKPNQFKELNAHSFTGLTGFKFLGIKSNRYSPSDVKTFTGVKTFLTPSEKSISFKTINGRYVFNGLSSSFSSKLCGSVHSITYPYSLSRLSNNALVTGFNGNNQGLLRSGLFFTNFNTGLTSKYNGFPSSKLSYSLFSSKFGSRLINVSDSFSYPKFSSIRASYFYPTKLALSFKKKPEEPSEEEKFNMEVDKALYRMAVSQEAYKRMWNGDGYDDLVAQAFMKKVVNGEATVSFNKSDDKVDIIISDKIAHNRANFLWNRGRNLENEDKKEDKKA